MSGTTIGMEKPQKKNCETCHRRGENKQAEGICRDCRIRFCPDCKADHLAEDNAQDHVMDEITSAFITETESTDEEDYGDDFHEDVFTKLLKSVTIKVRKDITDCQVRAICPLADDWIMVADSGNKSLKVFDNNYELWSSTNFPNDFCSLACVDNETVLTVWQKTLYYWHVTPKECLKIRSAELKNVGYGVTTNGLTIAVIESADCFVEFFDFDGNLTNSVDVAPICYGKPGYAITLDSQEARFYISNRDYDAGTKLLCVTFSGQLLWSCTIPASVGGIVELDDHILAVSVGFARVHRVTREGRDAGIFAKAVGHMPYHFCIQHQAKRLVVSHNNLGRDRNTLQVYNIL